jgi:uncharacterized GH25 family protein
MNLNSKKILQTMVLFPLFFFILLLSPAHAHEFWVNASPPEDGLFRADLGYGHEFPNPESIPEERSHIFKPLVLATPDGEVPMDQVGENYAYQTKHDLQKGTCMVLGYYQPTFWSKGVDGWAQSDRLQRPDADYVEEAVMYAKTIVNIQGAAEDDLIGKPTGMRLEIVPLLNPAKVKPGEKIPMQVLCDGKPAKLAVVEGTFAGFSDKEYKAFHGRTDLKGRIDFIPLKAGYWIVKVEQTLAHPDKERADEVVLVSTLTFAISQ